MTSPCAKTRLSNRAKMTQLVIVFLIAFALRAGFGIFSTKANAHSSGNEVASLQFDDEQWYWAIGQSYRNGDGMVGEFGHRAERMPLYPWILSWFSSGEEGVSAARWFQYVFGSLAACAVLALAWRISTYAMIAGLIVAVDPTLVGSASLLLGETISVTLLAALWWVALPFRDRQLRSSMRWAAAIALSILVIYAKESTILLVAALFGYLIFARRDRAGVVAAIAAGICIAASLLPWAYRNKQLTGEWIWLTSRGGISLYDGVHSRATGASDLGDIKSAPEVVTLSEAKWNRHFKAKAWQHILDDPARIFALSWTKLARTWSPVLNAADYQSWKVRAIFAGWYVPLYGLVLIGIYACRLKWRTLVGLLLPAICISAMHVFFVGSVRYRLVAMPTLAILAAIGLQSLLSWRKSSAMQIASDELDS